MITSDSELGMLVGAGRRFCSFSQPRDVPATFAWLSRGCAKRNAPVLDGVTTLDKRVEPALNQCEANVGFAVLTMQIRNALDL
jgi:hypothetical protein